MILPGPAHSGGGHPYHSAIEAEREGRGKGVVGGGGGGGSERERGKEGGKLGSIPGLPLWRRTPLPVGHRCREKERQTDERERETERERERERER